MNTATLLNGVHSIGESTMYDLYDELQKKTRQLDFSIKELRKNGTAYAQAEYDYKVELSQKALKFKEDGMPVTLIQLVIYGDKDVAKKRFNRDVAEAVYKANQEAINSVKLQLRLIENQISREYSNVNNGGI